MTGEATISRVSGTGVLQQITGEANLNATFNITHEMEIIWATLPESGSVIQNKDGVNIGTYTDASEIFINQLTAYDIQDWSAWANEALLKWANADDVLNDIDDSLTVDGTIKLFAGRDLFQRGAELRIILKT